MNKPGKLLKSKARFERDEVAELLESVAERVRKGKLTLGEGDGAVKLDLPKSFRVELEVEDSGKNMQKRKFELQLKWNVDEEGAPVEEPGPASGFKIA